MPSAGGGSDENPKPDTFSDNGGYYKFSNGLIMQWGHTPLSYTQGTTVTFPIPFPHKCLSATASIYAADSSAHNGSAQDMSVLAHVYDYSRTNLYITYVDSDGDWTNRYVPSRTLKETRCASYTWFAIGY